MYDVKTMDLPELAMTIHTIESAINDAILEDVIKRSSQPSAEYHKGYDDGKRHGIIEEREQCIDLVMDCCVCTEHDKMAGELCGACKIGKKLAAKTIQEMRDGVFNANHPVVDPLREAVSVEIPNQRTETDKP